MIMISEETSRRIRDALVAEYGMENETWAVEQLARVMKKLQAARRGKPKPKVEVLGARGPNAFTLSGQYIYVTRRLLEKLEGDASVAFLLAHELAHHDLGHLDGRDKWLERIPKWLPRKALAEVLSAVEARVHSSKHEFAADALALRLCVKAGYPAEECLRLMDALKANALDYGDLDAAYGPEPAELAIDAVGESLLRVKAALDGALATHPPIYTRRKALEALIPELKPPRKRRDEVPVKLKPPRKRRASRRK